MRRALDDSHGWHMRVMIVVLWRAGLRIQEALALAEHDLDHRRGSILIRSGKGGRRREVGMDEWGWEQLRPWLTARSALPIGPLFCIIDGPTRGRPWSGAAVRRVPAPRGRGGRQAQVRAASAAPGACARARAGRRAAQHHPAPARPCQPRHHLDLPPGDRPRGDHHGRAHAPRADDVRQRRAPALIATEESGSARGRSRFALAKRAPGRPNSHDRASSMAIETGARRRHLHSPEAVAQTRCCPGRLRRFQA